MSVGLGPEKKKPVEPYHRLIGVCMWISICQIASTDIIRVSC